VVPSKSDAKIHDFLNSLISTHSRPEHWKIVGVSDGLSDYMKEIWSKEVAWVEGKQPFVYATAINRGVEAALPDSDIVICGDDIRFFQQDTIHALCFESKGRDVVAPEIQGVCGQLGQHVGSTQNVVDWLTFNCVYIPRHVWNAVGPLDERFIGYGYDDVDWCIRSQGHTTLRVDHSVRVEHIDDSSFRSEPNWMERYRQNEMLIKQKYQDEEKVVFQW
jgi:GT2 family glycosyltransferase